MQATARGPLRSELPSCSGSRGRERRAALNVLRRLNDGVVEQEASELVRRALVETLTRDGGRTDLVSELDESLLGVRPKPTSSVPQALAS